MNSYGNYLKIISDVTERFIQLPVVKEPAQTIFIEPPQGTIPVLDEVGIIGT